MRRRIMPRAGGIVVEVGFGSVLNLPYFDPKRVDLLIGMEPDEAMIELAQAELDKMDGLASAKREEERHGLGPRFLFPLQIWRSGNGLAITVQPPG